MAGNRIYIQVDFQSQSANAAITALNQNIKSIGQASQSATTQASAGVKGFTAVIDQAKESLGEVQEIIAGLGIAKLATAMVQASDDVRKVQIAFEAMTHSAETAGKIMADLREVAKGSPFAFLDLAQGAQRLKAFGFEAEKIPGIIKTISNTASALGGSKEKIDSIILALGQMNTKGVAQGQELFRQLAEQGVQVFPALQKALQAQTGKLFDPMEIRKMVEKGELGGRAAADAILKGMEEEFGSIGEKMMALPTAQFQKLEDQAVQLATKIMGDAGPALVELIKDLRDLVEALKNTPDWLIKLMKVLAALVFGPFKDLIATLKMTIALLGVGENMLESFAGWAKKTGHELMQMIPPAVLDALEAMEDKMGDLIKRFLQMSKVALALSTSDLKLLMSTFAEFTEPAMALAKAHDRLAASAASGKYLKYGPAAPDGAGGDILGPDKAKIEHQNEIAQQALDRASGALLGGVAGINYKIKGLMREVAGNVGAMAKVELAKSLEILKETVDMYDKALDEQERVQHQIAENRINALKRTGELEVAATEAIGAETLQRQAELQAQGFNLRVANTQALRDLQIKEIDRAQAYQTQKLKEQFERDHRYKFVWALQQWALDKKAADDRLALNKATDDEIAKYRLDLQKKMADETAANFEAARTANQQQVVTDIKAAADLAKARVDAGANQTEVEKVAAAQETARIDIAAARQTMEAENAMIQANLERKVTAQHELVVLTQGSETEFRKWQTSEEAKAQAESARITKQFIFEEEKAKLEAVQRSNEAIIAEQKKVYDSVKSAFDRVWDALVSKTTSVWAAIGNVIKTAVLGALKEIVTSRLAASFTELVGAGHVGFGGGWRGLFGQQPIFGQGRLLKADQPNHINDLILVPSSDGKAVPVHLVNAEELAKEQKQALQTASPRSLGGLAAASVLLGAMALGGSRSPIEQVTSSLGFGDYTGPTFGNGSVYGGPGGTTGFAGDVAGYGGSGVGYDPGMSGGGGRGGSSPLGALGGLFGRGGTGGAPMTAQIGNALLLAAGTALLGAGLTGNRSGGSSGVMSAAGGGILGMQAASLLGTSPLWSGVLGAGIGLSAAGLKKGGLAGLGMDIGGGALIGLQLGGPIGALIGAGVGAIAGGLRMMFKSGDEKVRAKVKQVYGIDIAEQNIRAQILQIAKQGYGGNLDVAIMSPEVQEIVRMYSLATGKNPSGLPRPMYAATFAQSGAQGTVLQPVYQGGNVIANPYTGPTTTQYAQLTSQAAYLQVDPTSMLSLLSGQVTRVLAANPGQVAAANAAATSSGNSRDAQQQALLEPLTVMR